MKNVCIAVDIGASSGRIIKGTLADNKLAIEEIHRFKNQMINSDGHFLWELDKLIVEIKEGISKISEFQSIGVDTWGADYVLLNKEGSIIAPTYAYRDHRTEGAMYELCEKVSSRRIYAKTGIQFLQFNTLFQLYVHMKKNPEDFEEAEHILLIPDYINYRLTGKITNEFTNATTTQIYNIHNDSWDDELLEQIKIKKHLLKAPIKPGTKVGKLKKEVYTTDNKNEVKVIAPATHDTGSAVAAVPAEGEDWAYISSGTWSLMGIEKNTALCSEKAFKYNFTNEGGVKGTIRFLKNIMGLWLIQEVKRLYKDQYDFSELVTLAKKSQPFKSLINPNDSRFLNPINMILEIQEFCRETNQPIPSTPGEIARCIFESLAYQYRQILYELKEIAEKEINRIHIVGGGVQNEFLNQLCADFTKCTVYAGPVEATALGNLMMQFIALDQIESLQEGRNIIKNSFEIKQYAPNHAEDIEKNWERFIKLI